MADFDPELYLRLTGERWLASGGELGRHGPSPLTEAAQALVAVDAIEAKSAEAVILDYHEAAGLRDPHAPFGARWRARMQAPASATPPPGRIRVCRCEAKFDNKFGAITVHWVRLSEHGTNISVTIDLAPRSRRGVHGPPPTFNVLAEGMQRPVPAHFSGGGDPGGWVGLIQSDDPLPVKTPWIEIDGILIDLLDAGPAPAVTVEPVPQQDPAIAYLWLRLADLGRRHRPDTSLEEAIAALRAASLLARDDQDPDVVAVRWAAGDRHGLHLAGSGGPGAGQPPERVPPEWRSSRVARPRAGRGLSGTIPVGVTTPAFGGFVVSVDAIDATSDELRVSITVEPGIEFDPFAASLSPALAFWATDDRGNHYLGEMNHWNGGRERSSGVIPFRSLDRGAKELRLMPTALRERAVIAVPLEFR